MTPPEATLKTPVILPERQLRTPVRVLVPARVLPVSVRLVIVPFWKVGERVIAPPFICSPGITSLVSVSDPPVNAFWPEPAKPRFGPHENAPPVNSTNALGTVVNVPFSSPPLEILRVVPLALENAPPKLPPPLKINVPVWTLTVPVLVKGML